jgi:hypothetical protein
MKKKIFFLTLIGVFSLTALAFAAMKYECWYYKNGKPDKMVHVVADNNKQAVQLACDKFKDLDIIYEYVQCK